MGLRKLFKNILFLSKQNLNKEEGGKDIPPFPLLESNYEQFLYELHDDLSKLFFPNVMNPTQTIDFIRLNNCSLCRFGDGEFEIMQGNSIPFQEYSDELSSRLKEVFFNSSEKCLSCLNYFYFHSLNNFLPLLVSFARKHAHVYRHIIRKYINENSLYGDSAFGPAYTTYKSYNFNDHYKKIREIWDLKEITIIIGEGLLDDLTFNIYDNAKSINIIPVPRKNAFTQYKTIFSNVLKNTPKDHLVIAICGPTATVLCYDLFKSGYRALDLGHLGKDYNDYKLKKNREGNYLYDFYKPD